jgi:ribosomal protein S18 acetylase RimI-like enzyme
MQTIEPDQLAAWTEATDRNLELWTANLERAFVAEIDGEAAGYSIWMHRDGGAVLVTIHVLPGHRRHGLGTLLLHAFLDDAAGHGYSRCELGVHRDNPIRGLYERAGFVHTSEDGDYLLYRLTTEPAPSSS